MLFENDHLLVHTNESLFCPLNCVFTVVDSIDLLDSAQARSANGLSWLPLELHGATVLLSATTDSMNDSEKTYGSRANDLVRVAIGEMATDDVESLVQGLLAEGAKELDSKQMELVLMKEDASLPLYVKVMFF